MTKRERRINREILNFPKLQILMENFTILRRRRDTRAEITFWSEEKLDNCVYRVFSLAREATQIHLISQGSG